MKNGMIAYQQGRLFMVPVERCLYQVVLRPDNQMFRKIQALKLMADGFLGNKDSSNRLPEMALLQFLMHGKDENALIAEIRRVVDDMDAFILRTDAIASDKDTNAVYMEIENEAEVNRMKSHLLYRFYKSGLLNKKDLKNNADMPHIPIAKSAEDMRLVTLHQFIKSLSFGPTPFGASLVLLKKEMHARKWERVAIFHLPE